MGIAINDFDILLIIVAIAFTIQSLTGFGSVVVSINLGLFFYPIKQLVPILIILSIVNVSYLLFSNLKKFDRKILLRLIFPEFIMMMIIGFICHLLISGDSLVTIFAILVVLISIYSLYQLKANQGNHKEASKIWLLMSGFAHGLFSIGGPFLVYYVSRLQLDKLAFRTMLASFWLVTNLVLFTAFVFEGSIKSATFLFAIKLLPAVVLGIITGEILHRKISQILFMKIVYILLLVSGALIFFK